MSEETEAPEDRVEMSAEDTARYMMMAAVVGCNELARRAKTLGEAT